MRIAFSARFWQPIWHALSHTGAGMWASVAVAAAVRLLGVASRPIWYDEAFAILFAEKGPAAMVIGTLSPTGAGSADIHPLGYYTILWMWMKAFGGTLVSVRVLSILASSVTVGLAYLAAEGLVDRRAALSTGIILALSPFAVHFGQEIRMYSFLGLWLMSATYFFWRASRSGAWMAWFGFAASAALAQYTHNLAAAYLVALAAWPAIRGDWKTLSRAALAAAVALIMYVPWLINLPAQVYRVSAGYWVEVPDAVRLLTLPLAFVTNLPVAPGLIGFGLFCSLGATAVGVLVTWHECTYNPREAAPLLWMVYMALTPPMLLFLISQWTPVYLERALIGSALIFGMWLATLVSAKASAAGPRWLLGVLVIVGFAIGLRGHLSYHGFPYAPYEQMTDDIRSRLRPGDVVIHSSKLSYLPALYFDRDLESTFIGDPPGSSTDTLAASTQQILGVSASQDIDQAVGSASRVWFALFDQSNDEFRQAGYTSHPHLAWLRDHFSLSETRHWDDLSVYLFTR